MDEISYGLSLKNSYSITSERTNKDGVVFEIDMFPVWIQEQMLTQTSFYAADVWNQSYLVIHDIHLSQHPLTKQFWWIMSFLQAHEARLR